MLLCSNTFNTLSDIKLYLLCA